MSTVKLVMTCSNGLGGVEVHENKERNLFILKRWIRGADETRKFHPQEGEYESLHLAREAGYDFLEEIAP